MGIQKGRSSIERRQVRALKDVEKLQFQALDICFVEVVQGVQHHFRGFAGKSQYGVDDHFDAGGP